MNNASITKSVATTLAVALPLAVVCGGVLFVGIFCDPMRHAYDYDDFFSRMAGFDNANLARMEASIAPDRALPTAYRWHRKFFAWTERYKGSPPKMPAQKNVVLQPGTDAAQLCLFNSGGFLFNVQIITRSSQVIALNVYADEKSWERMQEWVLAIKNEFPGLPIQLFPTPVNAVKYYEMLKLG